LSSQSQQRRRDKRYATQLKVRTRIAGRLVDLHTDDVSFRGLFLCTDQPPPLRQLIRIEAVLPPKGVPFATHGMVVHVVPAGNPRGHKAGAGLQFYGMGDERRAWEAFVQYVQKDAEALPDRRDNRSPPSALIATPSARGTGPGRIPPAVGSQEHRRFQRFPVVLEVRPRDLEDLFRLYSRDVSVGGMFLATTRDIDLATEVRLDVRHPHNDTIFHLTAIVRRRSAQPPGIGVEFTGLDDKRRRELFEFIHAPIPTQELDEADLDLVESD
jgi:type IV pilus assembly protein PilZ